MQFGLQRRQINLSQVFAGQTVGVRQTDDHIWLETFMDYDLGYFDDETCRLEPIADPFGRRLSPMSPDCYLCLRNGPSKFGAASKPALRSSTPPRAL